jgi:lipoprotein-releasing system ATP-binding protein
MMAPDAPLNISFDTPSNTSAPLYSLRNLSKVFAGPREQIHILQAISLDIQEGETVAVVGASGSGKSTLLHILGTLASQTSGELFFRGRELLTLSNAAKAAVRNKEIGFIFQFHHLLPEFSTLENVAMQAIIGGVSRKEALEKAEEALCRVSLSDRASFAVSALSGGERQRAAIARAVLLRPKVLLADEPTGNLDEKNGRRVTELLLELNAADAMSMIVVTHNAELAGCMGKCFELKSGDLYEQTR